MPKSQVERLWLFAGGVAALLLLLAGWFLFIGPQRSNTASVNRQVQQAQSQNDVLRAKINQLKSQNANFAQYQNEVKQARLALPDSSGLSDFLRTLQAIGNATQTNVTTLAVGAPTNLNGPTGTAPAATSTGTAAPKTNTGLNGGLGPIYQLPITLSVTGSTNQLDEFLSQLQSVQPRAVLITQLNEGGATSKAAASAQTLGLTMQAFVAPSSVAENQQLAAGVNPTTK
jgi:Tfp pilus assembly protein PilO